MSSNAKLIKCSACNGHKEILGMGMIKKKCSECNGIGWITEVLRETTDKKNNTPIIFKKRGRPAKQIDMVEEG